MKLYKLRRIKSDKLVVSENFTIIENSDNSANKDPDDFFEQFDVFQKDDSLNISSFDFQNQIDYEAPLLSVSTDVKEIIEDFIYECKKVDEFYNREKLRISNNFDKFYGRFLAKISNAKTKLDLKEDLREQRLDGLGYSSSWARQFSDFYSKFAWLDGFGKINIVGMQKILLKLDKNIFDVKSSNIMNTLNAFLETLSLSNEDGWFNERRKIRSLVAYHYYKNNMDDALQFLEFSLSDYQSEDRIPLSFLCGMIAALMILFVFFLFAKSDDSSNTKYIHEVKHIFPIFRWILWFIIAIYSAGVVIDYLKEFRVNYVIIFESNPANRLKPSAMFILSAILMNVWVFWLIGETTVLKGYLPYSEDFFAETLMIVFSVILLIPIKIFRSNIRFPLIAAIISGLFSPFSEVRFTNFFVADVLTSLTKPFIDISLVAWWLNSESNDKYLELCYPKMFWSIFAWYLPFHIRFWQWVNKYYVTGDAFPHLVNAGKYFWSIIMIFANYFYGLNQDLKGVIIVLSFIATVYSYIWDSVMDWGLCRDSRLLRRTILYPPRYYYISMIVNLLLRFAWVLPMLPGDIWPDFFQNIEFLTFLLCIAEIP